MFRRDYFMRLVEEATAVLSQVLKLNQNRDYAEALIVTNDSLRRLTGLSSEALLRLDADDLVAQLALRDELGWIETCLTVVTVLDQEGDVCALQGREEAAYGRHLKALQLLLAVQTQHPQIDLPEVVPDVETLLSKVDDIIWPEALCAVLLIYFEQQADYAGAEDMIFSWREMHPTSPAPIETGLAFYERLLEKSDAELLAGNLPRDEVEAGLAELQEESA